MSGPGGMGYGADRQAANGFAAASPATPIERSTAAVVRLEIGVLDGPVLDRRPVDRSELTPQVEVDLAESRKLPVGVHATPADRAREVVHVAREQPRAVTVVATESAGLEEGIGTEEVAVDELQLVVRVVAFGFVGRFELDEVVAPFLEHDAVPPRGGDCFGERRTARPGAHDHDASVVAHGSSSGSVTSSSV